VTSGNASDVRTAPDVLAEAPGRIRRLTADKGYDADWLRADLREKGITPVIPGKRSRKRKIRHDKRRYRERCRVEAISMRTSAQPSSASKARSTASACPLIRRTRATSFDFSLIVCAMGGLSMYLVI
jgi:IS5 family transposase